MIANQHLDVLRFEVLVIIHAIANTEPTKIVQVCSP